MGLFVCVFISVSGYISLPLCTWVCASVKQATQFLKEKDFPYNDMGHMNRHSPQT